MNGGSFSLKGMTNGGDFVGWMDNEKVSDL